MANFVISTGQLCAAIRSLAKRSTTVTDVANIWLDILGVFFPAEHGFERIETYSAQDRVLIEVRHGRDLDGNAIFCDDRIAKAGYLIVDCRPHTYTVSYDLQSGHSSPDPHSDDFIAFSFGVISSGTQAVFLEDAVASQARQGSSSLRGVRVGRANLIKASGRDKAEDWLRKVRNIFDDL